MIAEILFWAGVVMSVVTGAASWFNNGIVRVWPFEVRRARGQDKLGAVFFPFMLLLAAAVARYLGL